MKQPKQQIFTFLFIIFLFLLVSLILSILYFLLDITSVVFGFIGLTLACILYFMIGVFIASLIKTKAMIVTLVLMGLFILMSLFTGVNPFYMSLLKAISCLIGCGIVNYKTNH